MRQYFLLSLFLHFNKSCVSFPKKSRRVIKSKSEIFFGKRMFNIINELFLQKYIRPLGECFKLRISALIRIILPCFEHFLNFFLITNDQINAVFLARYIAKKLEYHHRLKSLLNPLKREFKYLGRLTKMTLYKRLKNKLEFINWKKQIKILWKFILTLLIIQFEKIQKILQLKSNLKISINLFILIKSFLALNNKNLQLHNQSTIDLKLIKKNIFFNQLLFERWALFLLFGQNISFSLSQFNLSFLVSKNFDVLGLKKWQNLFGFLIYDFFTTKFYLLSNTRQLLQRFNLVYLKFGLFQYKRFLTFNYNMFSYSFFTNYNFSNNLRQRSNNLKPKHAGFLGFKIKCSGRFSRKQRASSYWFSLGSVPLNTVTAFIDYATYTVPLANSVVTIKVWIHKSKSIENLFFLPL